MYFFTHFRYLLPGLVCGCLCLSFGLRPVTAAENCQGALDAYLETASHPQLQPTDFTPHQEALKRFYSQREYQLAWLRDGRPTPQARVVMEALAAAEAKGLHPEDYAGGQWGTWADRLQPSQGEGASPRDGGDLCAAAGFDVGLGVSLLRYVSALRLGRVDPKGLSIDLDVEPKRFDLAEFLGKLVVADNPSENLAGLEPTFRRYHALLEALKRYRALAREPEFARPLSVPGESVRPGGRYADLPRLVHRLVQWGDLPAKPTGDGKSRVYTKALAEGVRRFQKRHGLRPDGVLGKSTFEQLNVDMGERVRQILLSLERWRWMPDSLGHRPVVINVPEFRLHAFDNEPGDEYKQALEMDVIVGESFPRHQTPLFRGTLRYVVFAPYWNVPPSILKKELLPKILRDPGYLNRGNYEVVAEFSSRAKPLPATGANLERLRRGELKLRQRPGPKNSLGSIQFLFPNSHSVYLHGTPSQKLFKEEKRDFSHGCIRVADPPTLAEHVLKEEQQWDRKRVDDLVSKGTRQQVILSQPLEVYVLYVTAVADAEGRVSFFRDVYGHDQRLAKALRLDRPQLDAYSWQQGSGADPGGGSG